MSSNISTTKKSLIIFFFCIIQMPGRVWTFNEEVTLLQKLASMVDEGVYQTWNGGFRNLTYEVLKSHMHSRFPEGGLQVNHIKWKIKNWMKTFHSIRDILLTQGFGWDEIQNKLVVDNDEVWNEFLQVSNHTAINFMILSFSK